MKDCGDYIVNYRFDTKQFDCTPETCGGWNIISTIYGMCCSFNFHPNNTSQTYYSNDWGKGTGISIIFTSNTATKSGFNVFIHHCTEYVTKATSIFPLIPGYENFIRIWPQYDRVSKHYLGLPLEQRKCFLSTDRNLKLFRQSRCRLFGFATAIYKNCGCHPYFMPSFENNHTSIRNCTIMDIHCFSHNSGNNLIVLKPSL